MSKTHLHSERENWFACQCLVLQQKLATAAAVSLALSGPYIRTSSVKPVSFFRKFYQLLSIWCFVLGVLFFGFFNYCFVTFSFRITLDDLGIPFDREALLPVLGTYPFLRFLSNTCCIWHSKKALTGPRHGCLTRLLRGCFQHRT